MNLSAININDNSMIDKIRKFVPLEETDFAALQDYFSSGGWLYNQEVVGIREFIESPEYLNAAGRVYPIVMDCLEELNESDYDEALLTGSIGSAKSTMALYTSVYQVYLLSAMKSPQAAFGLDPSSEIVIIFQSISEKIAKAVEFLRFKAIIDGSPYFKKHFRYDKNFESELRFPVTSRVELGELSRPILGGTSDFVPSCKRRIAPLRQLGTNG